MKLRAAGGLGSPPRWTLQRKCVFVFRSSSEEHTQLHQAGGSTDEASGRFSRHPRADPAGWHHLRVEANYLMTVSISRADF